MALAFSSIHSNALKALKDRANPKNQSAWSTKMPFARLTSFAVPKGDKSDKTQLRKLRQWNVLWCGHVANINTGPNIDPAGNLKTNPHNTDYNYANNSYRYNKASKNYWDQYGLNYPRAEGESVGLSGGRKLAPNPGLVNLSCQNKGSYGSLRALQFQIKCFDLAQLDVLEVLYMTPGIGVLAEWGWTTSLNSTPSLMNIDDANMTNKESMQAQLREKIINQGNGNYDGCIATITNYNWNIDKDGSYNLQIEAVSRGETMLNLPTNGANSIFVDKVARLTYDPKVKEAAEKIASGKDVAGVYGNIDDRSGQANRINQHRVPIFHYNFAQENISKKKKDASNVKNKANEIINENKKKIKEIKAEADLHYQAQWWWAQSINAKLFLNRAKKIKAAGKDWTLLASSDLYGQGHWKGAALDSNNLAEDPVKLFKALVLDGKRDNLSSPSKMAKVGIGKVYTDDFAKKPNDVGFKISWNWMGYGNTFSNGDSGTKGGMQLLDDQGNNATYRPLFIGDWHHDVDNIFFRNPACCNATVNGDPASFKSYLGKITKSDTAGKALLKVVHETHSSRDPVSGQPLSEKLKLFYALTQPHQASALYGNMNNPAVSPNYNKGYDLSSKVAKVYDIPGAAGSGAIRTPESQIIDLDGNKVLNWGDSESPNFANPDIMNKSYDFTNIITPAMESKALINHYLDHLPKLPIFAHSIKTSDNKPLITPGQASEHDGIIDMRLWWAKVDMQKWNTGEGQFQFIIDIAKERAALAKQQSADLKALNDQINRQQEVSSNASKLLNQLNETTGEYIPLWALEKLINECTGLSASGKRLFRYDSGFQTYDHEKDNVPPPVKLLGDKLKVIKYYRNLFGDTSKDSNIITLSAEGFARWKKYFQFLDGSDPEDYNEIMDPSKPWSRKVSLPVKVSNHKHLKTTNPLVCLIPGQEDVIPDATYIKGITKSSKKTADDLIKLHYDTKTLVEDKNKNADNLPDPELWDGFVNDPVIPAEVLDPNHKDYIFTNNNIVPTTYIEKLKPNPFKLPSLPGSNEDEFREGYIANILVHTDVVKRNLRLAGSAAHSGNLSGHSQQNIQGSDSMHTFYNAILQTISAACGNFWQLNFEIDGMQDDVTKIIDESYTKNIRATGDIVWRFPLWGTDYDGNKKRGYHILRDFSIASKIPSSMAMMALYGANASYSNQTTAADPFSTMLSADTIQWSDISLEGIKQDTMDGLTDEDGVYPDSLISAEALEGTYASDIFKEQDQIDEANAAAASALKEETIPETYDKQLAALRARLQTIHDNGPGDRGGRDSDFASKCMEAIFNNKMPFNSSELKETLEEVNDETSNFAKEKKIVEKGQQQLLKENPNYYNKLIPLDCSITLDGISGIYYGNSFALGGLPKRYAGKVAFQVTNVSHNIDFNGWQTTFTAIMRPMPKNCAHLIKDFVEPSAVDQEQSDEAWALNTIESDLSDAVSNLGWG